MPVVKDLFYFTNTLEYAKLGLVKYDDYRFIYDGLPMIYEEGMRTLASERN